MRFLSALSISAALCCASGVARAQSDTLPSSGSTAGVTILGTGRSLSPANLTPTGPRIPQGTTPWWKRQGSPPPASLDRRPR